MAIRNRFARRAVTTTAATTSNIDALSLSRGNQKASQVLDDGEYELLVLGATHRVAKSGSVVILLDLVMVEDETPVRMRPLLVSSPGGSSDLTVRNFEMLETLAGVAAGSDLRTILESLSRRLVTVDIGVGVDARSGQEVNELLDVLDSVAE